MKCSKAVGCHIQEKAHDVFWDISNFFMDSILRLVESRKVRYHSAITMINYYLLTCSAGMYARTSTEIIDFDSQSVCPWNFLTC
jgi:hypothetical protein